jgi:hypothetical protein
MQAQVFLFARRSRWYRNTRMDQEQDLPCNVPISMVNRWENYGEEAGDGNFSLTRHYHKQKRSIGIVGCLKTSDNVIVCYRRAYTRSCACYRGGVGPPLAFLWLIRDPDVSARRIDERVFIRTIRSLSGGEQAGHFVSICVHMSILGEGTYPVK